MAVEPSYSATYLFYSTNQDANVVTEEKQATKKIKSVSELSQQKVMKMLDQFRLGSLNTYHQNLKKTNCISFIKIE